MYRNALVSLLSLTALAGAAIAAPINLDDRPHYPLGAAVITPSSAGLEISNIGSSGNDGVLILPHPNTREMHVHLSGAGGGGAGGLVTSTAIKASWNLKENVKRQAATMIVTNQPSGETDVSFDYSGSAADSLTAEYYYQGALVLTEENLPPNPPGGTSLRVFPGATINPIPANLSWRRSGQPPRWGFNIGGDGWEMGFTIGGNVLPFDHVIVTAVHSVPLHDSISGFEITTNAASSVIITGEDVILGGSCPGDLNSDGFVDDADFVEFAAAYNQLLCD
jgi:hypothetical protein